MFQHRRGHSLAGLSKDNRRNLLTTSLDDLQHSKISARLERVSMGGPLASKPKCGSTGVDDLLKSDGGKHDYDWLLTPPGTPSGENKPSVLAPAIAPATRSVSAMKSSRIPTTQSETTAPVKPTRSISTTRPSTSSSYFSGSPPTKSVLSTSSMSVNSRPSTPSRRPVAPSPSSQSRPSTPSRTKPPALSSSRPSTPTSRPQITSTIKPAAAKPSMPTVTRTASRPSTPTRRPSTETPVPASPPIVRSPAMITRSPAVASRARSPSPRPHGRQPLAAPDFRTEAPPNLRTTAPERPSSASRSRPGSSYSTNSNEHSSNGGGTVRRPSPARGREQSVSKERVPTAGHGTGNMENTHTSTRTPASRPPSSTVDNGGFGRTISRKSMDMAIRHMDIRHSTGSIRSLAGSSIFPQSIRSTASKIRPSSLLDTQVPNGTSTGKILENGHAGNFSDHENGKERSHIVDLIAERLAEKLREAVPDN